MLGRVRLFAALPERARDELRSAASVAVLGAGQRLWRRGDRARFVGVVIAGRCKLIREDSGREVIVDVAVPGDLLGAVGFALDASCSSSVVCLRRARVLLIPSALVRAALQRETLALAALAAELAAEVARLMGMVQSLSAGNVERRLACVLLALAERAGQPFPGGTFVPLRLRRADLAALSATTLESASRCISSWRRRKLLTPQPSGYLLHDVAALRAIAAGE
ncbi:MAG: Crp/Fnr family transcriptional regulator [Deltaproteobacteria bacterium]|nr:Crp/Fnr family transcriptional regulator [Deltaproteobacteria bacterium]